MAIETADNEPQLNFVSKTERLEHLYAISKEIANLKNDREIKVNEANALKNEIKAKEKQRDELLNQLDSGQLTFHTEIVDSADPEPLDDDTPSDDDLEEFDPDGPKPEPAESPDEETTEETEEESTEDAESDAETETPDDESNPDQSSDEEPSSDDNVQAIAPQTLKSLSAELGISISDLRRFFIQQFRVKKIHLGQRLTQGQIAAARKFYRNNDEVESA